MGHVALAVAGAVIVATAAFDLFLTVFNYDGFTFLAKRYQDACWSLLRIASAPLPARARHAARSVASATLLPLTMALWLGGEICGFALIDSAGLANGGLTLAHGGHAGMSTAFYMSAGTISTLTFGDVLPHSGAFQATVDLEAIVGLSTFTLALGYVVTAFSVLGDLNALHNTVRRHAADPERPSSVLARHYRGGDPSQLPALLQTLSEHLESYDEGLRRYPVVFYFHTRRARRSIPMVFAVLGELLSELRWGLPPDAPMAEDPWVAALLDQYVATLERLQRSFVGPVPLDTPPPSDRATFDRAYASGWGDPSSTAFLALQRRTRAVTGHAGPPDAGIDGAYRRYCEWLRFEHRRRVVVRRIAQALGYEAPPAVAASITA